MDQHERDQMRLAILRRWRGPELLPVNMPAWQDGTEPRISTEQANDLRRWFNKESV